MDNTTAAMKMTINRTSTNGAVINGTFVTWDDLWEASHQGDRELATAYTALLRRAKDDEKHRLVSENWKRYGYPLRTGFDEGQRGLIVRRAWEIRRVIENGRDLRKAYIVTDDRSNGTREYRASPAFETYEELYAWLGKHYGAWTGEYGLESTASAWLY